MKILMVSQSEWGDHLGQSKVHYDLKREYEKLGFEVDTLTWFDIYPGGANIFQKVFGPVFTKKILKILQKSAYQYDVIDSNHECIPYPKESFNFPGLLMYRSHGLQELYDVAENIPSYKEALDGVKKNISLKTRVGNIYRSIQFYTKINTQFFLDAIKYADIVHCLNTAEYNRHLQNGVSKSKLKIVPNGLPDDSIVNSNKLSTSNKLNTISFVGSWSLRKGIKDLNAIISTIDGLAKLKKVKLLGTGSSSETVKLQFENQYFVFCEVVPSYKQSDLGKLLQECKVGMFPSYAEGFPLAVVEQLACGIPVVAYNVPGPSDILNEIDHSLLIEPGNTLDFGSKVADILNLGDQEYQYLAEKCKSRSRDFLLSTVSKQFISIYNSYSL